MSKFSTHDLIQQLHDKRLAIRDQQSELVARMEAMGDREFATASPSLRAQWEARDAEFVRLGERLDELLTGRERENELEDARKPFNHSIRGGKTMEQTELSNWLRHGGESNTENSSYYDVPLERHDLTKGASPGSELIPTGFSSVFFQALTAATAVRQTNAVVLSTTSGENLLVPKATAYGAATLVAEGGALLENDPTLAQVTVGSYKYGQLIQVTRELVEDSAFPIEDFVATSFGETIGAATGAAYVTGTGSSQPQGIANAGTAGVTLATGQTITITSADSLINLYFSVAAKYRQNAYWVMNDVTAALVRSLKTTTNDYVWQSGLTTGVPDTLLGKPVLIDNNVAVPAANALTIAFGDFSKYFVIRDAGGLRIDRSDDFAFSTDLVSFRAVFRTDSKQVINGASGAVKWLKQSAT